jgi:hypothetical protein
MSGQPYQESGSDAQGARAGDGLHGGDLRGIVRALLGSAVSHLEIAPPASHATDTWRKISWQAWSDLHVCLEKNARTNKRAVNGGTYLAVLDHGALLAKGKLRRQFRE